MCNYDKAGTIHALIGVDDLPSGVEVMREPAPGMLVTEVEGVELDLRPECFAQLQQFIDGHTVEVRQTSSARIIAKG